MAQNFDDIKQFISNAIQARSREDVPEHLRPSAFWMDFCKYTDYVRKLDDGELLKVRNHTWHLTADNYQTYYFHGAGSVRRGVEEEYEYLIRRLGLDTFPGEGEHGLGFDTRWGKVCRDRVRYLQVLLDLHEHDALAAKGTQTVLEIGGGFGGLASVIMKHNPAVAYVLLDLEETLFFQAVNLTNAFGRSAVVLCESDRPMPALEPGKFYLVPQARFKLLEGLKFDLAINQQSMQEMNQQQVDHYCTLLENGARLFYSSNLDHHNQDLRDGKNIVTDLNTFIRRRLGRVLWDSYKDDSLLTRLTRRLGPIHRGVDSLKRALSHSRAASKLYRLLRGKPLGRHSDFKLQRLILLCRN